MSLRRVLSSGPRSVFSRLSSRVGPGTQGRLLRFRPRLPGPVGRGRGWRWIVTFEPRRLSFRVVGVSRPRSRLLSSVCPYVTVVPRLGTPASHGAPCRLRGRSRTAARGPRRTRRSGRGPRPTARGAPRRRPRPATGRRRRARRACRGRGPRGRPTCERATGATPGPPS